MCPKRLVSRFVQKGRRPDPARFDPARFDTAWFEYVEDAPEGADDAVSAAWVPIDELTKDTVAADHLDIVDMLRE